MNSTFVRIALKCASMICVLFSMGAQGAMAVPVVRTVSPASGDSGQQVTLTGTGFGATQGSGYVNLGDRPAIIVSWTDTRIVATVAAGAMGGTGEVFQGGVGSSFAFQANPPLVSGVSPTCGVPGTQVTFAGSRFGSVPGSGYVILGSKQGIVLNWSDTQIVAQVDAGAESGYAYVVQNGASSAKTWLALGPKIQTLSPTTAAIGAPVNITGSFWPTQGNSYVLAAGTSLPVTSWSASQIVVTLPQGINTGSWDVSVFQGGVESNRVPLNIVPAATISSLSPASSYPGNPITINGSNFGATQGSGSGSVWFNSVKAGVNSWSSGAIIATVPGGTTSGPVVVNVFGVASNGVTFTVIAPPQVTASVSPAASPYGWHNSNVTVTFTCTPGDYPIASCPGPQTVTAEGANLLVSGTATDTAGGSATAYVTLNIDKTPPLVSVTSPLEGQTVSSSPVAASGTVDAALSGFSSATCNGAAAPWDPRTQTFSCNVSLNVGVNLVMLRATDRAGNVGGANLHVNLSGTLPPPTSLTITPAGVNMPVGGEQEFTAVDELGKPRADTTWTVSDPSRATISPTQGFPLLSALAAGQVTLTASIGSVSAQMQVNIIAGASLPEGSVRWSVPVTPGYVAQQVVQGNVFPGSPDFYSVEAGSGSALVRALSVDGGQMWASPVTISGSIVKGIPDASGGMLLSVKSATGQPDRIVRLDAETGTVMWEYQAPSDITRRLAIGRDGVVYFREGKALVGLDPAAGARVFSYDVPVPPTPPGPGASSGASLSNPIVDNIGAVLAEVHVAEYVPGTSRTDTISLLRMVPGGGTTLTQLKQVTWSGSGFVPQAYTGDVIPDGNGGALASWGIFTLGSPNQNFMTYVSGGGQSEFSLSLTGFASDHPMVFGENGVAFASDGTQVVAFNASSGQVLWSHQTAATGGIGVHAATAGGGLLAKQFDEADGYYYESVLRFDAAGNPATDSWVATAAASLGAPGLTNVDVVASDDFFANSGSGQFHLISSTREIEWPIGSVWPTPRADAAAPEIILDLKVFQVQGTAVSPNDSIDAQVSKAQTLWEKKIPGLKLKWNSITTSTPDCVPLGPTYCDEPKAHLTTYHSQTGCDDSIGWIALTIRFPNGPSPQNKGVQVLFTNSILNDPPGLGPDPDEVVPVHDAETPQCGTGNLVVMSNQAFNYVLAHSIGHVFGLANTSLSFNLMCSGSGCLPHSQMGTGLFGSQIVNAKKGLKKWL